MMSFLGFLILVLFCNSPTIFSQCYRQGPYVLLDPIFAYVWYVLHVYKQSAPRPYNVPNSHVTTKGLKFLLPHALLIYHCHDLIFDYLLSTCLLANLLVTLRLHLFTNSCLNLMPWWSTSKLILDVPLQWNLTSFKGLLCAPKTHNYLLQFFIMWW